MKLYTFGLLGLLLIVVLSVRMSYRYEIDTVSIPVISEEHSGSSGENARLRNMDGNSPEALFYEYAGNSLLKSANNKEEELRLFHEREKEKNMKIIARQMSAAIEQMNKNNNYNKWLESRKDWIEGFPLEPEYHPSIVYDNDMVDISDRLIKPVFSGIDSNTSLSWDEKLIEKDKYMKSVIKHNEKIRNEYWRVENHAFLKQFHNNPMRFTEEFEQSYNIFNDMGYGDNTILQAYVFNTLKDYYKAMSHDPNEMSDYGHTWEEEQFYMRGAIMGPFNDGSSFLNDEPVPTEEEAKMIVERLMNEIPGEGFVNMSWTFSIPMEVIESLEEGDPLLYK